MIDKFNIADNISTLTYYTDYYDKTISEKVCTSLKCLDVTYISASGPEENKTKRPCYIHYKHVIIVETKNKDILEELFILTTPIKYIISQREGQDRAS